MFSVPASVAASVWSHYRTEAVSESYQGVWLSYQEHAKLQFVYPGVGWLCSASGLAEEIPMDVLSEVLKAVKLDGAVFFHGEFAAPWCAREPDASTMAAYLPTQAGHIIIFHLLLEGRGMSAWSRKTVPCR